MYSLLSWLLEQRRSTIQAFWSNLSKEYNLDSYPKLQTLLTNLHSSMSNKKIWFYVWEPVCLFMTVNTHQRHQGVLRGFRLCHRWFKLGQWQHLGLMNEGGKQFFDCGRTAFVWQYRFILYGKIEYCYSCIFWVTHFCNLFSLLTFW